MKRIIKSVIILLSLSVASCATTSDSIQDFLRDNRGKVVGWQFNGSTFAYDYIAPTGNRFVSETIGVSCETGTFAIIDDQICYHFDPSARSPLQETYCYEVIAQNDHYDLKLTKATTLTGEDRGIGIVISSVPTNRKSLECK